MAETVVEVGEKTLRFTVEMEDYNKYLNAMLPNDKVNPAYNFLVQTVHKDDKATFKELVMVGNTVNGVVVLQLAAVIAGEMGGGVEINLKKPSK